MTLDDLLDMSRPPADLDAEAEARLHAAIDGASRPRRRLSRRLWIPTLGVVGALVVGASGAAIATALAQPAPWFAHEPAHASMTRVFHRDFTLPSGDTHHCRIAITVSTNTGGTSNKAYATEARIVRDLDPDDVTPDPKVLNLFLTGAETPAQRGEAAATAWTWGFGDLVASRYREADVNPIGSTEDYHDVGWSGRNTCD